MGSVLLARQPFESHGSQHKYQITFDKQFYLLNQKLNSKLSSTVFLFRFSISLCLRHESHAAEEFVLKTTLLLCFN